MAAQVVKKEVFPAVRRTPLPGGYMGKLLRVDMTSGAFKDENLPEEPILRKYWGGQALAIYVLLNELPLNAKPYDREAVIVMMTGPITGNGFSPGGTKMTGVYLSPATKYTLGRGATSGYWPVALKSAGYDGIIVTGKSDQPKYLFLNDGKAELRDASAVWGKGTRETEDALRKEVGYQDARVACIGPAGENLVSAAMLVNDLNHNAAHGLGAVMGSKMLKAVVARGTKRPPIRDKPKLVDAGQRWAKVMKVYGISEHCYGTGAGDLFGGITRHNWRATEILPEHTAGYDQNNVTQRPCFQCRRMCPWDVELTHGKYKGMVCHFGAGSEWLDTPYNLDITSNEAFYFAERTNDLGIEASHFACGAGLAFEAYEKGLLDKDRTDGLELKWGDVEAADRLLEMCCHREGWLGNLLADGPRELALALGGDAPKWVVHTKGGTPAQHEWRPLIGLMLRELVSSGGMKPQGGAIKVPPPDLRYRENWAPLDDKVPTGWPYAGIIAEKLRQFCGLMGGCWFAQSHMAPDGLKSQIDVLNACTGWDVTLDEAMEAGHRSMILQSIVGIQRGWKMDHDWKDVGPRFLEPVPDGKHRGFTIAKWLPDMILEYYRLSGRGEVTGRPLTSTLEKLGLEEFAEWADQG